MNTARANLVGQIAAVYAKQGYCSLGYLLLLSFPFLYGQMLAPRSHRLFGIGNSIVVG